MGHSLSTVFLLDYLQKNKKHDRRVYYTRQEIAKHNTESSMWIVAGDKVYDITRNGESHSRLYIDLESRDDKRGGAWMNNSQTGYEINGDFKSIDPLSDPC